MLTRLLKTTRYAALGLGGILATGCFYNETPDAELPGHQPKPAPTIKCSDVTVDQQAKADAFVAKAQLMQAADVEMMASQGVESWTSVDEARIHATIALYDQALAAAPGHCGAVFGRALGKSMLLLQDQATNEALNQSLARKGAGGAPLAKAFKASQAEAASLVLQVASGVDGIEKPFISAQQDRFATEVLPGLDTVIASLDAAMARDDFSVRFTRPDGRVVEVDQGEIGPVLGGLKVAKAVVTLLAGYQWEFAQDGSYAFIDRLNTLHPGDFKNLNASQREALDHLTGLFAVGSPFTRVKPGWKDAVRGIPALLLAAIENTQVGLRYALSEAGTPAKQIHDLYRVGTTEADDVDPADLIKIIDALERMKKYLRGEVALVYHRTRSGGASHTLKVNFPKVFEWDGMQNYLPYYKVNAYEQWVGPANDEDTAGSWRDEISGIARSEIYQALDLSYLDDVHVKASDAGFVVTHQELDDSWFGGGNDGPETRLADLAPVAGDPCKLRYAQSFGRVRDNSVRLWDDAFHTVVKQAAGVIDLGETCRVDAEGRVEYRAWYPYEFRAPFHFTDAAGSKTLEPDEVEEAVETLGVAAALTGKLVFRDPTFGGVFPELTNENIWATIAGLEGAGPRLDEKCDEFGWCQPVLPNNPSDLDVWAYYLFWLDNLI